MISPSYDAPCPPLLQALHCVTYVPFPPHEPSSLGSTFPPHASFAHASPSHGALPPTLLEIVLPTSSAYLPNLLFEFF